MKLYDKNTGIVIGEYFFPHPACDNYVLFGYLENHLIDTINRQGKNADLVLYAEDNDISNINNRMAMSSNVDWYIDKSKKSKLFFRGTPIKEMHELKASVA